MNGTTISKNEQIRQMYKQGLSVKEIAQKLGVSYQRAYQVAQKMQNKSKNDQVVRGPRTCYFCGTEVEYWVAKNDLAICPDCLKKLSELLVAADWDNLDLKEGDCPYCGCSYIGVEDNGKFVCADCLTEMVHEWFEPGSVREEVD
jgi:transposase-like protein